MAIAFELVVNFGTDQAAVDQARAAVLDHPPLVAGEHRIPLHPPLLFTPDGGYLEMSVLPVGVGWGIAMEHHAPRLPLTPDELDEVGFGLYDLLHRFTGYLAAVVGKNPEDLVDLDELRADYADEVATGQLPGLVLADEVHQELHGSGFTRFAPGHLWIPYQGEWRP
jgi:hypothetical protein